MHITKKFKFKVQRILVFCCLVSYLRVTNSGKVIVTLQLSVLLIVSAQHRNVKEIRETAHASVAAMKRYGKLENRSRR